MASTEHTYTTGGPGVAVIWTKASNAAVAVAKVLRLTNQTQMAADGSRVYTVTPTNEEDSAAFFTFLETALPVGQTSGTETARTRESGTPIGGGASGGVEYIMGVGGPVGNKGTDDVRRLHLFNGSVDPTSGSLTQSANNPAAPTFVFKTSATSADTTVSHTLINAIPNEAGAAELYERAAGNETIPSGAGHKIVYVAKYTP